MVNKLQNPTPKQAAGSLKTQHLSKIQRLGAFRRNALMKEVMKFHPGVAEQCTACNTYHLGLCPRAPCSLNYMKSPVYLSSSGVCYWKEKPWHEQCRIIVLLVWTNESGRKKELLLDTQWQFWFPWGFGQLWKARLCISPPPQVFLANWCFFNHDYTPHGQLPKPPSCLKPFLLPVVTMTAFSLALPLQQQSEIIVFALLARCAAVQFCTLAAHGFSSRVHTHIPLPAHPQLASVFPGKWGQE